MFETMTVKYDGQQFQFNAADGDLDMSWDNPTDDAIRTAAAVGISNRSDDDIQPNLTGSWVDRIGTVIHIRPDATFA